MNILYLIKNNPDPTLQTIIDENKKNHTVSIIYLKKHKDYNDIIDQVEACDKVISG